RRHTRSYGDWSSDVCSSDLTFAVSQTAPNDQGAATTPSAAPAAQEAARPQDPAPRMPPDGKAPAPTVKAPESITTQSNAPQSSRSEERRVGKARRSQRWRRL